VDQPHQSKNEPLPRFRVDFEPLELPFTCTLTGGPPQKLATATVLDSGYVMIDPESRQAIFVVISNDEATVDSH
jgi:hypothetical protein